MTAEHRDGVLVLDVQTTQAGDKGKVVVEALNKEGGAENFLSISGTVVGPDMKERELWWLLGQVSHI